MIKIRDIYESIITEVFNKDLTTLTSEQLQEYINEPMDPAHYIEVFYSKFIKIRNGIYAEYAVVTFDSLIDNTYLVNYVTIMDSEKQGIIFKDITPIPEKEFDTKEQAIDYVKSL